MHIYKDSLNYKQYKYIINFCDFTQYQLIEYMYYYPSWW